MPAGGAKLSATMKSSRFMGSEADETLCSEDLRSCAMPLGGFCTEPASLLRERIIVTS